MKIKEIYAGKPDAGDEIQEKGYESFANYFIEPSGVDIDGLVSIESGTPFFIIGDKGTGKTALLHFLENRVHEIDSYACTSFISIRRDYDAVVLNKFNTIGRAISTSLSIDSQVASVGEDIECDFTYIWRWQLYQRLIDDNNKFNGGLFVSDSTWDSFVDTIKKISATIDKNSMHIPAEIKFFVNTNPQSGTITPGMSISPLDVSNRNFGYAKSYTAFVEIIKRADGLFAEVKRTDTSYYIFIDELEAFRNDDGLFFRDLRLIRDLMFTVKKLNEILHRGTKILCSIRQEIINAINRFINPYQLQKITQGFDVRLIWKYTNTNSFSHPIMEILLKRILEAEIQAGNETTTREAVIAKWFSKNISKQHICRYILDRTWHKPRDIVRLLLAAQSTGAKEFEIFNQHTFETFMPVYSKQCLDEVREEMRALYSNNEIEAIFSCLRGYKTTFSLTEITTRAQKIEPDSLFAKNTRRVLIDLYRIGIIGNHLHGGRSDQWAYKEQYTLIPDDPWKMIVHPALYAELSIGRRTDRFVDVPTSKPTINSKKTVNSGPPINIKPTIYPEPTIYDVEVQKIMPKYITVVFLKNEQPATGEITLHYLGINNIVEGQIEHYLSIGDHLQAKIYRYNPGYDKWSMIVV